MVVFVEKVFIQKRFATEINKGEKTLPTNNNKKKRKTFIGMFFFYFIKIDFIIF